jgi:hypothetical protein
MNWWTLVNNKDRNSRDPLEEEARKLLKRKIQATVFLTEAEEVVFVRIFSP